MCRSAVLALARRRVNVLYVNGSLKSDGFEMEEQIGGFGLEGYVADFVDDRQLAPAEPDQLASTAPVETCALPFRAGRDRPGPGRRLPADENTSTGTECNDFRLSRIEHRFAIMALRRRLNLVALT